MAAHSILDLSPITFVFFSDVSTEIVSACNNKLSGTLFLKVSCEKTVVPNIKNNKIIVVFFKV